MKISGGCHCGAITYEAEADPKNASICHCTDCQRLTGAAFRTSVRADLGTFSILTGEPRIYVKIGDSGGKRAQAFCERCGSPIYAAAADAPEPRSYNIRLGTVRQRDQFVPTTQIWCRSQQKWLSGLGSINRFEKDRAG